MTYGTSANTYLVGRRPSRSSPHRQSKTAPIGKRPAIRHRRRGLIALEAHFAHFYLTNHPPNHLQRPPLEQFRNWCRPKRYALTWFSPRKTTPRHLCRTTVIPKLL